MKLRELYLMISIESENLYKPGTYIIQLWGSASKFNIKIIQMFYNTLERMILNTPKYVLTLVQIILK